MSSGLSHAKSDAAGFTNIDASKDRQYFVDYLDVARSRSGVKEGKNLSFSLLGLKPGDLVLDVGCGTGDDVIALAEIIGEKGRAIGIDNSEVMIDEARRRASKSNASNVEFHKESIYQIHFPSEKFNGVIVDRVFMHLEEPGKALQEIIRVTKKGDGRIVVHDPDWDSFVIDSQYKDVTRKIVKTHSDLLKNGATGRKMYGMFKEAGLVNVTVSGGVAIFTDYNPSFQLLELEKVSRVAVENGLISDEERTRWINGLQRNGEQGRFFASFMTFRTAGTRP